MHVEQSKKNIYFPNLSFLFHFFTRTPVTKVTGQAVQYACAVWQPCSLCICQNVKRNFTNENLICFALAVPKQTWVCSPKIQIAAFEKSV
jgi:hypothetical protein